MEKLNVNKRVFGYLIDSTLAASISTLLLIATRSLMISQLGWSTCMLLRDCILPTGSIGKKAADLQLEPLSHSLLDRVTASVVRNINLTVFSFVAAFFVGKNAKAGGGFILIGMLIMLMEYFYMRGHRGKRVGDKFADTLVKDNSPLASGAKYFWLCVLLLFVQAAISKAGTLVVPPPTSTTDSSAVVSR